MARFRNTLSGRVFWPAVTTTQLGNAGLQLYGCIQRAFGNSGRRGFYCQRNTYNHRRPAPPRRRAYHCLVNMKSWSHSRKKFISIENSTELTTAWEADKWKTMTINYNNNVPFWSKVVAWKIHEKYQFAPYTFCKGLFVNLEWTFWFPNKTTYFICWIKKECCSCMFSFEFVRFNIYKTYGCLNVLKHYINVLNVIFDWILHKTCSGESNEKKGTEGNKIIENQLREGWQVPQDWMKCCQGPRMQCNFS